MKNEMDREEVDAMDWKCGVHVETERSRAAAVAEQYGFEHPTWWVIVFIDGILWKLQAGGGGDVSNLNLNI